MKLLALLALCAAGFGAEAPKVIYTKSFPGSVPAYVWISIERSGSASYKEAPDEDPENFKIEPGAAEEIFRLADKLDHFKRPIESGLKVARMGDKTFRWENGAEKGEAKYNYSTDENARALQDWFEHITQSQMMLSELQRAVRHDRLGVNQALINISSAWNEKRVVGLAQFLPLLDRVAKDTVFINIARERAAELAEAFRAAAPSNE